MPKKKGKLVFIPFDDTKYYKVDQDEYEDDIENKSIDKLYRRYSETNYPEAKLEKYEFEKIVKELREFQHIKRKLTHDEGLYVLELGRAIEPKRPQEYLNDIRFTDGGEERLKYFRDRFVKKTSHKRKK